MRLLFGEKKSFLGEGESEERKENKGRDGGSVYVSTGGSILISGKGIG